MKKFIIKNNVLDAPLYFLIGPEKECTKFLNSIDLRANGKEKWTDDDDDDIYGSYFCIKKVKEGLPRRVIHIKKFKGTLFDIGVLSHEIQHYVNDVCISKGLKITRGDEETTAYLMEYTLKECLKALNYK